MDTNQPPAVRLARNIAEKQRRDKLNSYINELANTVPLVANATKRLDKTSILRLSAAYLRLHKTGPLRKRALKDALENGDNKSVANWRPNSFSMDHLKVLMDAVDGFVIVANYDYKLIYVSPCCEKYLGHQNIDLMGYSLTAFIHPGDEDLVKMQIEMAKKELIQKGRMMSERISFRCRMRERNQPRTEVITYQVVQVVGNLTFDFDNCATKEKIVQLLAASRKRAHDALEQFEDDAAGKNGNKKSSGSDGCPTTNALSQHILFKCFVQIIPTSPMAELSLIDANLDEYVARLSLDGTLLFADHRISMITGYMPHEVVNKSAYGFILFSDHAISLFAHKLMLSSSNGTGIIVHRLKTKSGGHVYMQSAGCLQYDRETGQVDHFVCVARLLVEEEGDKEREKFVKRFTPHISNSSPNALYQSLQIVIGPRSSKAVYSQQSGKNIGDDTSSSASSSFVANSPSASSCSTDRHFYSPSPQTPLAITAASPGPTSCELALVKHEPHSPAGVTSAAAAPLQFSTNVLSRQFISLPSASATTPFTCVASSSDDSLNCSHHFASSSSVQFVHQHQSQQLKAEQPTLACHQFDAGNVVNSSPSNAFRSDLQQLLHVPQYAQATMPTAPISPARAINICSLVAEQAQERLNFRGHTTVPLLMQLQKNASSSRYTYSDAAKSTLENPSTLYSVDTMTQYNGVDQSLTGAIVFGIDQINGEAFQPRYADTSSFAAPNTSGNRHMEATSNSVSNFLPQLTNFANNSVNVNCNNNNILIHETQLVPDSDVQPLGCPLTCEVDQMTTSMPTPPLCELYGSTGLPSFLDESENASTTRNNNFDEAFDLFFSECIDQSSTFTEPNSQSAHIVQPADEESMRPAKRKRTDLPSLESENLRLSTSVNSTKSSLPPSSLSH